MAIKYKIKVKHSRRGNTTRGEEKENLYTENNLKQFSRYVNNLHGLKKMEKISEIIVKVVLVFFPFLKRLTLR